MSATTTSTARPVVLAAFVAFGAFGAFWGVWGASVPRIQTQAGVSDGQLGLSLMFVGGGAIPAMVLTGRVLDRWGLRLAGLSVGALGLVGAGMAGTATGLPALCVGLALVGATSGAADVAMNAVAGRAETQASRPVITRAHGAFSAAVVVGSLGTGVVSAAGLPLLVPFVLVAVVSLVVCGIVVTSLGSLDREGRVSSQPGPASPAPGSPSVERVPRGTGDGGASRRGVSAFVLLGVLGALAFASENAHQSWSAVFAHVELGTGLGLAAVAPAVFAAVVAVSRFSVGGLGAEHARTVLLVGATAAALGAVVVAISPTLLLATAGLALAAAGTGVLFPTLMGILNRGVEEEVRGRATSVVTSVSYVGFVLGPVYVGLWSDAVGLRGAMLAIAMLGLALLALVVPVVSRTSGTATSSAGDAARS